MSIRSLLSLVIRMKTISFFSCLLYAAWTEGTDISVEGFERGEVSFQCSHRLARMNDKYFCHDPCESSLDTLATVKSGKREKSGRVTLVDSGSGAFTVTFSQLQLSDSGTYWCAVDRPGLDTYTRVHLTVKEAVVNETTTDLSTTWTYPHISNSTQLTSEMDTSRPANVSPASNCTNGEQSISTSTVLYATLGAFVMLTSLVLVVCSRKRGGKSKPQPQVCSNSTDLDGAVETEVDYDDIDEAVLSLKQLSERSSFAHHPKQDPLTPALAECSTTFHIYENICFSKNIQDPGHSTLQHVQDDTSAGIYIKPLPDTTSPEKHINKPTDTRNVTSKPAGSCTSSASASPSSCCSGSAEERPRSLWFGLDLSGTS